MQTTIKFTLPEEIAEPLREHNKRLTSLLKKAERIGSNVGENEAEFTRLSREIVEDEENLDPKDREAASTLAAKREQHNALSRLILKQDAQRPNGVANTELVTEMRDGAEAIRAAAVVVVEMFTAPIEKAIAPYCVSAQNANGVANLLPAVKQFAGQFQTHTFVELSSYAPVHRRLATIKTLLSGEVPFEFKGASN